MNTPDQHPRIPGENLGTMASRCKQPLIFTLAALGLASMPSVSAQVEAPTTKVLSAPADSKSAASDDAILELTPFEVRADKDVGFAPTSALTGGRMRLELKDSAMAYSALTREFIDAMGITDLNSASQWTTNSFKILDPAGGGDTFNLPVLGVQRGSGSSSNRMVNFFPQYAPLDTYRMERVDFGRGPNAVMFGNGTLGGTQVGLTKRANFTRAFQKVDMVAGSYDYYRQAIDVNQPLGKYAAARLNLLNQDASGWRDFTQDVNRAISGTASFKVTPKTEIRVDGERGRQERQIPTLAIGDSFAGWNGVSTFNASNSLGLAAPRSSTGTIASPGNSQGVGYKTGNTYLFSPSAGLGKTILEYQNDPVTQGAGATATTPYGPYTFGSAASFNSSGGALLFGELMSLPSYRFDAINASPYAHFEMPSQTFVNSVKGPASTQDYQDIQLTLSQEITPNLFFEAAGMVGRVGSNIDRLPSSGLASGSVDINRVLPDGSNNPNFGRFYSDSQFLNVISQRQNKAWRASLAYLKNLGKWGNYGLNALVGSTQQKLQSGPNQVLSLALNPDHRKWVDLDVVRVRKYWTDGLDQDFPEGSFTFKDNNYTQNGSATQAVSATVTPKYVSQGASFSTTKYNYGLLGLTAKYFKNRLVFSGAVRQDRFAQTVKQTKRIGDYPSDWDGKTLYWREDAPADWSSLTYRPYDATGVRGGSVAAVSRPTVATLSTVDSANINGSTTSAWFRANPSGVAVRDLRYESDRFQDDFNSPSLRSTKTNPAFGGIFHLTRWASVGYNYAGSYSVPGSATPTVYGTILPPTEGKGFDITNRYTLFDGRLNVIYTYYENDETNGYVSAGSGLGQVTTNGNINGIYGANVIGDLSSTGRNARNGADVLAAANDTRGRHTQGNELEISGNVTKGWRIQASIAKNLNQSVDAFPLSLKYIAEHEELFKQIVLDTGATIDSTTPIAAGAPGTARFNSYYFTSLAFAQAAGFGAERVSIEQQSAVDNYNNLFLNRANLVPNGAKTANIVSNVYTDYTIQQRPASWVRRSGYTDPLPVEPDMMVSAHPARAVQSAAGCGTGFTTTGSMGCARVP